MASFPLKSAHFSTHSTADLEVFFLNCIPQILYAESLDNWPITRVTFFPYDPTLSHVTSQTDRQTDDRRQPSLQHSCSASTTVCEDSLSPNFDRYFALVLLNKSYRPTTNYRLREHGLTLSRTDFPELTARCATTSQHVELSGGARASLGAKPGHVFSNTYHSLISATKRRARPQHQLPGVNKQLLLAAVAECGLQRSVKNTARHVATCYSSCCCWHSHHPLTTSLSSQPVHQTILLAIDQYNATIQAQVPVSRHAWPGQYECTPAVSRLNTIMGWDRYRCHSN